MASKKYILFMALAVLIQTVGLAQKDWGWDWKDSARVSVKNLPQHNEFLNNQHPYPGAPRNQWELGLGIGLSSITGDVKSKTGFGGMVSLRKAITHVLSFRAGLAGLLNSGEPNGYEAGVGRPAYKNQTFQLSGDILVSLNAASHYRGNPKTNVYLLGGYSLNGAKVLYKSPGGAQPGGYRVFYGFNDKEVFPNSQKNVITTIAGAKINGRQSIAVFHGFNLGAGIAYKIDKKINIGLEHKYTFSFAGYDFLDGVRAGNSNDYYGFTSARVNINIGNTAKRVEPLWWLNPNNFVYSELNSPKHMKLPKPVLPDGDNDGIADQFDLELNTPKGAPVDSHGVSKDTDGDGVPDSRDKEILTQQSCFPVNNDGVGSCPEPGCCKELRELIKNRPAEIKVAECAIGSLPSIQFKKGGAKLSKAAEALLAAAAARINSNALCNVKVIGYGASSKAAQQISWDRVNAVIKYLVEKQGVSESRFIFSYGQDGDLNTVDLSGTTESGPNTVPAPHPNLRKKG